MANAYDCGPFLSHQPTRFAAEDINKCTSCAFHTETSRHKLKAPSIEKTETVTNYVDDADKKARLKPRIDTNSVKK